MSAALVPQVRAQLQRLGFDEPIDANSVGLVSSLLGALQTERQRTQALAQTAEAGDQGGRGPASNAPR